MYIVIEKKSKKILHINNAPLSQNLTDKEVFHKYNPKRMLIRKINSNVPAEDLILDKTGEIINGSLSMMVRDNLIQINPNEELIIDDSGEELITEIPLSQQLKNGTLKLSQEQKISIIDGEETIVEKSLEELVDEGVIVLGTHEKIENGKIVEKTLEEKLKDKTIILKDPFQTIQDGEIINRNVSELLKKKLLITQLHFQEALKVINDEIEQEIFEKYSPGQEIKILKDYVEWQKEGEPKGDLRLQSYLTMQSEITAIKSRFNDVRREVKNALEKFN